MKALVIELNGRELERFILYQPTLFIGRSPSCDVVLRVRGVKPLHYLIEWVGEGEFDPNRGFWTLMDLTSEKKDQARGEGLILSQKKNQLGRFVFGFTDDAWIEKAIQKGRLKGQLTEAAQGDGTVSLSPGGFCLEVVSVRADSERVEDVAHTDYSKLKDSRWLLRSRSQVKFHWQDPLKAEIEFLPSSEEWEIRNRDEFISEGKLKTGKKLQITPRDVVVGKGPEFQYYIRLVPKIRVLPQWKRTPMDPFILIFIALIFLTFAASQFLLKALPENEEIKAPQRIVKVELPKPVEPPPTPELEPAPPEAQPVLEAVAEVKPTPKPKPEVEEIQVAPPKKNEPKAQAKPAPTLTPDPGLIKPLPKNTGSKPGLPGVLGVLRKRTGGAEPLKADSLVVDRPSSALDAPSGTVAVARSNPGALSGSTKGASEKGVSLDSAGTQLKGGFVTEPGGGGISGSDSGTLGSGAMAGAKASGRGTGLGQGMGSGFSSQMEVQGGLDRESVRRAIREYTQQIRSCYNNFLTIVRPKDDTGRVTLNWQIRTTGQVTLNAIKTNTFNDAKLGNCIKNIVDRIQFPKAPNGLPTNVVYPFVFQGKSK
jgi:hypothetical protein